VTLTRHEMREDVARTFGIGVAPGPARFGLEVEAIPVDLATGHQAPIVRSLPALEAMGWAPRIYPKSGMTELHRPDGARLTFEPGGQIEYSTMPHPDGSALLADVDGAFAQIERALADAGLAMRMLGLDPVTPIDEVPLQLDAPRYRRMDAHFASVGPSGRRMMRQTAAVQLSIDVGPRPLERWRLLGTLAPIVAATFANSPSDTGTTTGERSIRRRIWDDLDPSRTGLRALGAQPVDEYLEFGLAASAFLLGDDPSRAEPFAAWLSRGATLEDWHAHLSTLFPDVRPRGYFEFRVADACGGDAVAALVALVAGIACHPAAATTASARLPAPTAELLARAGRHGLSDPELARAACTAVDLALAGCAALGRSLLTDADVRRATRFFDTYTRARRTPADDLPVPAAV
jgi:glutamate--cysteine ligase